MIEKKPSEPKIDINALAELLEEKLGAQETRLMRGVRLMLEEEHRMRKSFTVSVLRSAQNAIKQFINDVIGRNGD